MLTNLQVFLNLAFVGADGGIFLYKKKRLALNEMENSID